MRVSTAALVAALLLAAGCGTEPPRSLGLFTNTADIGGNGLAGSASYDTLRQTYTVAGSGENMWFGTDAFRFVWRRVGGDFTIRAEGTFQGDGVHEHRKLGVIARADTDPGSPYVDVAVHGDGLTSMQYRTTPGADTEEIRAGITGADVVQLQRSGDLFVMSVARFGEPFVADTLRGLAPGDSLLVGLFVCSHDSTVVETATFRNVRLVIPPPEGWVPYRDYIGSNLEILDVETGYRRVVHTSDGSIQAPNWTTDGEALIYNQDGLLVRFDLATGTARTIDTGFATRNNNDHVLSFDGRTMGISNHSEAHDGESIVYTVPVGGGVPVQVTPTGPSYLHGWSPDGRFLVYTAQRDGDYDIYRIPVEGGEEVRVTDSPGLDDGPEYAPDGASIWLNSVRSGTMQLWRMDPDGYDAVRMTDDGFNDWFPHLSPDGSRVAFVSFMPDVDPSDHPFYRPVLIRLMPAGGGPPRVIAYVFGGQGTMNVPSWSPDGRFLAFVSNTRFP